MPDADGNPTPEEAAATIAAARQQQADAAALQEQLTQAQARNLELEVAALHTANPDLPDAALEGADPAPLPATPPPPRAPDTPRTQTPPLGLLPSTPIRGNALQYQRELAASAPTFIAAGGTATEGVPTTTLITVPLKILIGDADRH